MMRTYDQLLVALAELAPDWDNERREATLAAASSEQLEAFDAALDKLCDMLRPEPPSAEALEAAWANLLYPTRGNSL